MAEVAQVGVQRFAAGDDQVDGAQHEEAAPDVLGEEGHGVLREHRRQHGGLADNREHAQDTELMMAGSVLTVLPVLVLFLALQRSYLEGITLGGVKE